MSAATSSSSQRATAKLPSPSSVPGFRSASSACTLARSLSRPRIDWFFRATVVPADASASIRRRQTSGRRSGQSTSVSSSMGLGARMFATTEKARSGVPAASGSSSSKSASAMRLILSPDQDPDPGTQPPAIRSSRHPRSNRAVAQPSAARDREKNAAPSSIDRNLDRYWAILRAAARPGPFRPSRVSSRSSSPRGPTTAASRAYGCPSGVSGQVGPSRCQPKTIFKPALPLYPYVFDTDSHATGGRSRCARRRGAVSSGQRIATGLITACTAPSKRGWPSTNRNSQPSSAASARESMFSRM